MQFDSKGPQFRGLLLTIVLLALFAGLPAFASNFNLFYERVVHDPFGNEIGYQKVRINSWQDLPVGHHWRNYLTQKVDATRTLFDYARDMSAYMTQPLNITLSDRDQICSAGRSAAGYNVNMYKYVTQYSSTHSQKFVFIHELGHIAMLNAYPPGYNFSGLDYGPDNRHYMDEILPNHNTAWVEGWASAFAALNNNGYVFSLPLEADSIVAFLKNHTFEEMTRNELFIGKVVYEAMRRLPQGRDKVFRAMALTGPHNSLKSFLTGYLRLYPNDQVALARILDRNSHGKMSLHDMLDQLNNGSNVVSQEFYSFLNETGRVDAIASNPASPSHPPAAEPKKSFWERIFAFFSDLFGRRQQQAVAPIGFQTGSVALSVEAPPVSNTGGFEYGQVLASRASPDDGTAGAKGNDIDSPDTEEICIAAAQEEYRKAFAEYNRVLSSGQSTAAASAAAENLKRAKDRLRKARERLR